MSKGLEKTKLRLPITYLIVCFGVTFLCYLVIFKLNGIGLYGPKTILISDMKTQYLPFFTALRSGDVFYTNTIALSGSFSGTFAYYLSSPFSLLVFLFKPENIETAILLMIYLKLSAASASFCFMQHSLTKQGDISLLLFPLSYSMMSFCFFFFINVFWLDSFIYLPLIVLTVLTLIKNGKAKAMPLLLALLFISNFYISYIVGLFILLLLLVESIGNGLPLKDILDRVLRLVAYAALALAMSSIILLPAAKDLALSLSATAFDGYSSFNFTFKQFILKLFLGSYDSIGNLAAPTIFCGSLIFVLASCFFLLKNISKREKMSFLTLVVLMLVSFLLPALDKVWHMFSYPNSFAYRYAFCFSFLLIYLSIKTLMNLKHLQVQYLYCLLLVPILCVIFIGKLSINISLAAAVTIIITLTQIVLSLILYIRGKASKGLTIAVLVIINLIELVANGGIILHEMQRIPSETSYVFPLYSDYVSEYNDITTLLLETKDKGVYRVASLLSEDYNSAALLRYHGINGFSSCYSPKLQQLYKRLGYTGEYKGYLYREGSPETDSFFGVRWLLATRQNISSYHVVSEVNGIYLLETDNANPTGIMFAVTREVYTFELTDSVSDNIKRIGSIYYENAVSNTNSNVEVVRWDRRTIEATADADVDFVMQTTLPYDKNYVVRIDDRRVVTSETLDALLAFDVPSGYHNISIVYLPVEVYIASAISVTTICLYCLSCFILLPLKRKKSTS